MIKIKTRENDFYIIEFIAGIEISKTHSSLKYEDFIELMNTINNYKNNFMKIDL